MNFIDDLKADHDRIHLLLDLFRQCLDRRSKSGDAWQGQLSFLRKLIEKVETEIVASHFLKEEKLLFPELETIGVSVEHGPIELLLREHQEIRDSIGNLAGFLNHRETLKPEQNSGLWQTISDFIRLVEIHSKKEETVIFEVAKRHITGKRLREMTKLMTLIDI